MDTKLEQALDHCRTAGLQRVVLAIPFPVTVDDVRTLRADPLCSGLVLYCPSPDITADSSSAWLGCFEGRGDWTLPLARGTLVFLGSHLMLTQAMARKALQTRRLRIVCHVNGRYQPLWLHRVLLWPLGEQLYQRVARMPHGSLVRRTLFGLASSRLVTRLWRFAFRREGVSQSAPSSGLQGEALYAELCRRAMAQPGAQRITPVPGRVLLVNAGLAAGGAERQIVNTLIGLDASGRCESVALLAEYIDHAPHLDFFLDEVQRAGIAVHQVQRRVTLAIDGLACLPPPIAELAAELPHSILEETVNLVEEFRARRPQVVHAWQDSSSIKAGLAALIAGVPHIVLASRNVIPTNFGYYQDYMHPAYRALAEVPHIRMLNNSEAGAVDYTSWLGLPRARFAVVRNGVDLRELRRAEPAAVADYRGALGIPTDAPVVGSVFRFWEEKRPMLWLAAAASIAEHRPDVHFLVVGEGPMRGEMQSFIDSAGLQGRVHLPGAKPGVATELSSMTLFVLTSAFEGTPNVVLEAQWLGLPVVATEAGGTRETFEHGVSGLLADAEPQHIASRVLRFLDDPQRIAAAAVAGPAHVQRLFSPPRMVDETLALYGLGVPCPVQSPSVAAMQEDA
jgi:glycosyltransferase involved in cell wall biosynthesis